jgi:RNA polymerase sigma factor (sigma-70 family)
VKTARARIIFDYLRKAVLPKGAGLTDGQLLRQYFAHRDEAAFAVLVRRHGPMVLAVCRRLLRCAEDAEDAFQAAFVVLARKGRRIAERQTIGGWLHGVAYHVALDAGRRGARRRAKEQQVEIMPQPIVTPKEDQSELLAVLDRELTRLPEKYRLPVVLCELEGRSRKEAARQLGLPEGTLSSRLATARKTLAKRMVGRGVAVMGASLTALLASEAGAAVVPGPLVASTVRAAGGVVSAGVVALAEGVLKAMLLTKIKSAGLVLLLAASVGVGTVTLTYRTTAAEPQAKADAPRTAARAASPGKDDLEALRLEVEALRVRLQATQERVKGLEAEVHALKADQPSKRTEIRPDHDPLVTGKREATAPATPKATTTRSAVDKEATPSSPPADRTAVDRAAIKVMGSAPGGEQRLVLWGNQLLVQPDAEAKIKAAAARLISDPTNKQLQEAAKQAVEQLNSPETKVKKAAAFLMKCPENEEAQNGLKEALEQLNRSTEPKWGAPKQ